jgi:hypothetical protein
VPVAGPTAEVKFDVWIVAPTEDGDPKPVAQLKRARTLSRE